MSPTNHRRQHGSMDPPVSNVLPAPMEEDNGNGLTITASLSEAPRFATSSSESVTVTQRPGDQPITHTVFRQGSGVHAPNVQGTANIQFDVLGTIAIGERNDTSVPLRPLIPQQHVRPNPESCTLQIFVMNFSDSRKYTFEVQKNYRVEKLIDMIFVKLRIPKIQQRLHYAGKNMEEGMTLDHYGIKENSTVFLTGRLLGCCINERCPFQIFVKNFSDSTNYTFEVMKDYRVEKLMDMIFYKLRIPKDQQLLTYAGQPMVVGMPLEHYDVNENSTVFLTGRIRCG